MRQEIKYWYIRDNRINDISQSEITFSVFQKRRPQIGEGDVVLIYSNGYFKRYGYILEISGKNQEKPEEYTEEKIEYKYTIGKFQLIEEPNDLAGFAYSLQKVYKYFNEPEKHFKRDFGTISEHDFNTIIHHDYCLSRTAFGRIINSIHRVHKEAFITNVVKFNPQLILSMDNRDYNFLFKLLIKYINSHIIAQAQMLDESNHILRHDLNVNLPVGFIDPKDELNKVLVINRQVQRINNARNNYMQELSLDAISEEIISRKWEDEFHQKEQFNDTNLLLDF